MPSSTHTSATALANELHKEAGMIESRTGVSLHQIQTLQKDENAGFTPNQIHSSPPKTQGSTI